MDNFGTLIYVLVGIAWLIYQFWKKKRAQDKPKDNGVRTTQPRHKQEILEKLFGLEEPEDREEPVEQSQEEYRQPSYFYDEKKLKQKNEEREKKKKEIAKLSEASEENEVVMDFYNELRTPGNDLKKGFIYHEIFKRKDFW